MSEPADLTDAPPAPGGTEMDVVRSHVGGPLAAAQAAEAEATEAPPAEPAQPGEQEPWRGPSREEYESLVQRLGPLVELVEQLPGGGEDYDYEDPDDGVEEDELAAMGFSEEEIEQILEAVDREGEGGEPPTFDGTYADYLRSVLQHQIAQVGGEVGSLVDEIEEIRASREDRELREQARHEAGVQAAQTRAWLENVNEAAHAQIAEYGRKVGMSNLDVPEAHNRIMSVLVGAQEALRVQGATDQQIGEILGTPDTGRWLVEQVVNDMKYRTITDNVFRRVGLTK